MSQTLLKFGGVQVRRVIDRSGAVVPEHAHDWPVLSLFVMGGYRNVTRLGVTYIEDPSAILYGPGAPHGNVAGPEGFEQIEIEFDPDWLGVPFAAPGSVRRWCGGTQAVAARMLGQACLPGIAESTLYHALQRFIVQSTGVPRTVLPAWARPVRARLEHDPNLRVRDVAAEIGLHPNHLGTAYARATGEGLPALVRRLRVERAARLLRETAEPAAGVAVTAGFFDQSHMVRCFRQLLGRTPSQVRDEAAHMRDVAQLARTRPLADRP